MSKIIYIADPEILAIPIVECHEPLIDIKGLKKLRYGPPPECKLTAPCYTKVRETVFHKLCQAEKDLPQGWYFRLYEGFRSLAVQEMLFDQQYQKVMASYPERDPSAWFYESTRLVSPVKNLDGSNNIPAHNTGGAVDIEIITEDGKLIDMGMTAQEWTVVSPELCLTGCKTICKTAQENRALLLSIMESHGFINYPTEWWHFSYGDRYWAYYQSSKTALYGSADKIASACP